MIDDDAFDGLSAGTTDLLILGRPARAQLSQQLLFQDRFVCAVAADHPLAGRHRLTLPDHLRRPHVRIDIGRGGMQRLCHPMALNSSHQQEGTNHVKLHDAAHELIGRGTDATLVTLNPDGSPQVSVIWVALQSTAAGDEIVSAHLKGNYLKLNNIRRDPRVALTIVAGKTANEFTRYLWVSGTARIVEGGARELATALADELLGQNSGFPPEDAPAGFLTRVRIDNVGGVGPWASTSTKAP